MKYSDRLLFQQLGRWVTVQQPKNVGSSYANICFEMRILCWEWRSCLHSLIFSCDLIRFTATWLVNWRVLNFYQIRSPSQLAKNSSGANPYVEVQQPAHRQVKCKARPVWTGYLCGQDREEGLETGLEKSWSQSALQLAPTGDCSMNYSCLVCQC
ncbi:hypothetical protein Bbelb_437970 [Branchiostoma belcheri]|nr:hypothetical protein Bbelb_437970 [Branchiostoma belcheri]